MGRIFSSQTDTKVNWTLTTCWGREESWLRYPGSLPWRQTLMSAHFTQCRHTHTYIFTGIYTYSLTWTHTLRYLHTSVNMECIWVMQMWQMHCSTLALWAETHLLTDKLFKFTGLIVHLFPLYYIAGICEAPKGYVVRRLHQGKWLATSDEKQSAKCHIFLCLFSSQSMYQISALVKY